MRSFLEKGLFHLSVCALSLLATDAVAQSRSEALSPAAGLPDVVGIRPGMPAQEAYNLLKARNLNVKIGIGQMVFPGLGEKPIPVEIAAQVVDAAAPEIITVWLTTPPGKQVVFAVGRTLDYDKSKALLRTKVLEGLRQKYGPETDSNPVGPYWGFDEQGKRPDTARLRQMNCMSIGHGNLTVTAPPAPTFPGLTTVLYSPGAVNFCDSFIKVNAQLTASYGVDPSEVDHISVMIWDLALERRSQEAYQAFLANGDAARQKAELEKAKQRKGPDL